MKYLFKYSNQHKAQACALFCMDFRFKEETLEYLKNKLGMNDLDVISLAGASLNIANPKNKADYEVVMNQIDLSANLHKIDKIIIIDHADCGAYGGRAAFNSVEEEKDAHVKNLIESKEILNNKYPEKEIVLVYADLIQQRIVFEKV